jgi:hypothetical protein
MAQQLPVPPKVKDSPTARELVRVFFGEDGKHHIAMQLEVLPKLMARAEFSKEDADAYTNMPNAEALGWGIVLADVARHIANGLAQCGKDKGETLAVLQKVFADELDRPTDEYIRGGVTGTINSKGVMQDASDFTKTIRNDYPMSDWFDLMGDAPTQLPEEEGLFVVRATMNGKPIAIPTPKGLETGGTLYIKGVEDLRNAVTALKEALVTEDRTHPAVDAYVEGGGEDKYPKDGLQFMYVTLNMARPQ